MANRNEPNGAIKGRHPQSRNAMPSFATNEAREAAVWIEGGKYVPKQSYRSLIAPPEASEIRGLQFRSDLERLSALVVKGDRWSRGQEFALADSKIELSGCGCSDFTARGAGAMACDGGDLTIRNSEIVTRGSGRCATIATEAAVLKVYDSKLASHGGPLPADYEPVIGPGMMEPPWPLGLAGNCRTHLSMDGSLTYFYNCDIFAEAWGAVSTDSSGGSLYLEANDCRITVAGNGYGTYADNGCHNVFNRCAFQVGNMLAIQDGNSSITLRDTTAACAKAGLVLHGGLPDYIDVGLIDIQGGDIHAGEEVILAKSTNVDIYVRGAKLSSDSGILLHVRENDDPMYLEMAAKGPDCYGVQATFEDMDLTGDIIYTDKDRKMRLSLENTSLRGAITGSPILQLFGNSSWTATADSAVTLEGAASLQGLDAPAGVTITARAGAGTTLTGSHPLPSGGTLRIEA